MSTHPYKNRQKIIQKLQKKPYDLIIIGGGITGAGIALDATTRGLKTALIEKNDFASGTSSKSTKLIHGGLRYLKQFEIALVSEVGHERSVVHGIAPHLVRREKMILPLITGGTYGKLLTSFGLMVYDVLAGVEREDQRKMLSKAQTLDLEPSIREDLLEGGGIYAEYRTDDARLTIEILKTASSYGADVINYAEALDFVYSNGKISGIKWCDNLTGNEFFLHSKYTISATGPWVDELRRKNKSLNHKILHPTKGVHIVVSREKFPIKHAIYFDVPDGRMIFAIPRNRVTYIGTTDTEYNGDLEKVNANLTDVNYLIQGVNHIFPSLKLNLVDVESSWAGLRPLIEEKGKSPSELSRKDEIFESQTGLLSIAGGKLTGYRKMAERILDRISKKISEEYRIKLKPCQTANIVLCGGVFSNQTEVDRYQKEIANQLKAIDKSLVNHAEYLVNNYGKQTDFILSNLEDHNCNPEIKMALSELNFTIENEYVFNLLDFYERRTGRLYFDIASIKRTRNEISKYLSAYFEWNSKKVEIENKSLDEAIRSSSQFECDSYTMKQ